MAALPKGVNGDAIEILFSPISSFLAGLCRTDSIVVRSILPLLDLAMLPDVTESANAFN
jgi:hypothetical protein